jgi:D-3-phosphoglycerate dehydrogenase
VIGTGQIGREVIKRGRAFGMPVIAWSRSLDDEQASKLKVTRVDSPIDVANGSDIVTLHVAATPETNGMVNEEFCAALRPGAILINTTRGSLVDEDALIRAMDEKGVMAGLDVYANEPGSGDTTFDSAIAKHPNVVGTHHVGASTNQAQEAIAGEAVRIVRVCNETGMIPNVVNSKSKSSSKRLLIVRHENRPGVLAHVISKISEAKINIEEMDNVIYQGDRGAKAKIRLSADLSPAIMSAIEDESAGVLSVELARVVEPADA